MTTANNTTTKRILFASFPGDGHFNPKTGLAVHLASIGHDVRWYTSANLAGKLEKMQIPHYPFKKAIDISDGNFNEKFPGRDDCKTALSKLKFDIINVFILRAPEYYADLLEIQKEFPFDLLIADCAFTAIPFVKDLMKIPVISIGVFPLTENSKDLPPNGLGLTPSYTVLGKMKQSILRWIAGNIIFKKPDQVLHKLMDEYNMPHHKETVFDMLVKKSDLLLQSGTPGFEYHRSDMSGHVKFIGALLPWSSGKQAAKWFDLRLNQYKKIILVTQGTVEKDVNKLLVPTLEAFKDTDTLVICTTGGSQTSLLQEKYPQTNIIIEDFIPFNDVMPYTDVYITNGGYGGVMLGIENKLPLVVAGVHEGKNEICARVGYFKLGINLKTEKPTAGQLKTAVEKVLTDTSYKENVKELAKEFAAYDPNALTATYIAELFTNKTVTKNILVKQNKSVNYQ